MTERLKTELSKNGVDLHTVLDRFLGREDLYEKFLVKFLADDNFSKLEEAVKREDAENAFIAAHTLKGVTGNLGLDGIMDPLIPVVEILRSGKLEGVEEAMVGIRVNYDSVCEVIREETN